MPRGPSALGSGHLGVLALVTNMKLLQWGEKAHGGLVEPSSNKLNTFKTYIVRACPGGPVGSPSTVGDEGSVPGHGTNIPNAAQRGQNK